MEFITGLMIGIVIVVAVVLVGILFIMFEGMNHFH